MSVLWVHPVRCTQAAGCVIAPRHRPYGQYTLGPLPMDHVDPARMRADYDCLPQDEFHGDGLTKVHNTRGIITQPRSTCAVPAPPTRMQTYLCNEVLHSLGVKKGSGLHRQLEDRFASAPREHQDVLKHFTGGIAKLTNSSHTELTAVWKQMLVNACLLVPGEDWLAMLTWGVATSWLRQDGAVSCHDMDTFLEVYHLSLDALTGSSFNRQTKRTPHSKLRNLAWHDLVHGPDRIRLIGKFWSTGFFEQCHDMLLKRCACGLGEGGNGPEGPLSGGASN